MMTRVHRSTPKRDSALTVLRWALVVLPLSCAAASSQSIVSTASVSTAAGSTATARAAAHRCHSPQATIDACDDAIRWNPKDPSLLIAMGDVQMRAQRPADAARAYRHALALAPNTPGIEKKISNAEARLARAKAKTNANAKAIVKTPPLNAATAKAPPNAADARLPPISAPTALSAATAPAAVKRFSNADPETQSH